MWFFLSKENVPCFPHLRGASFRLFAMLRLFAGFALQELKERHAGEKQHWEDRSRAELEAGSNGYSAQCDQAAEWYRR